MTNGEVKDGGKKKDPSPLFSPPPLPFSRKNSGNYGAFWILHLIHRPPLSPINAASGFKYKKENPRLLKPFLEGILRESGVLPFPFLKGGSEGGR